MRRTRKLFLATTMLLLLVTAVFGGVAAARADFGLLPIIQSVTPADGATNVGIDSPITVKFKKDVSSKTFFVRIRDEAGNVIDAEPWFADKYTMRVRCELGYNTTYNVLITMHYFVDIPLCSFSFTTKKWPEPPEIVSITPHDGEDDVSINSPITVRFSKPIGMSSISVILKKDNGDVVNTAQTLINPYTLKVSAILEYDTEYHVTVKLMQPYTILGTYSFTTERGPDVPRIDYTTPGNGDWNVEVNSPIIIKFYEKISPYTVNVTVEDSEGDEVEVDQSQISNDTVKVDAALTYGTRYTVTVNIIPPYWLPDDHTAVYAFSFVTEKDMNPPYVTYTSPVDGATGVNVNSPIIIGFSERLDPYEAYISVWDETGTPVNIRQSTMSPNTVKVEADLKSGTKYIAFATVVPPQGMVSIPGIPYVFSFSTEGGVWPQVMSTSPANGATDVSTNCTINIQYSGSISQYGHCLELRDSSGVLVPTVYDLLAGDNVIRHTAQLSYNKNYTVSVWLTRNNESSPRHTFSFSTVSYDTSWPQVTSTSPANGATGVDTDCEIVVCFSKPLSGYNHYLEIRDDDWDLVYTPVLIESEGNVIRYEANLARETKYNVVVKLSRTGTYETVHTFSFTTEGDSSALPHVTSTTPSNGATNVSVRPVVKIKFSSSIDPYNVSVTVRDDYGNSVYAVQTYTDSRTVELEPELEHDRRYVVAVKLRPSGGEYTLVHSFSFYTGYGYSGGRRFSDVPEWHWAYEAISYMADRGIISGFTDGTFRPDETVTREQFAKIMVLALDLPLVNPSTPTFEDVDRDHWAYRYIESAKRYLTGYKSGSYYYYRGSEGAVREDMACALVKAKGYSYSSADESRLWSIFDDADSISSALRKFVLVAYDRGLIRGYTDRTFRPQGALTRAEAAKLLYEASIVD